MQRKCVRVLADSSFNTRLGWTFGDSESGPHMVVHLPDAKQLELPRPETHSYPTQFAQHWNLKSNIPVIIRAIRSSDETLLVRFHETLSDRSVYLRYFSLIPLSQRIAHEQLMRTCLVDDREFALVAVLGHEGSTEREIAGLGQISKQSVPNEVEWGLVVADEYQNQGLGIRLCECLLEISRSVAAQRVVSMVLPENYVMRLIARRLGFKLEWDLEEHAMRAALVL